VPGMMSMMMELQILPLGSHHLGIDNSLNIVGVLRACSFYIGNWDLKIKVPQQCEVSGMKLAPYFIEWINLEDIWELGVFIECINLKDIWELGVFIECINLKDIWELGLDQ
ncbi:ERI1 exoribonuclease 3, partial [Striga asiatica]